MKNFMGEAIKEAEKSLILGEVPVGVVIVRDNIIIAKAHNLRETLQDPLAHAEMLAIKKASQYTKNWRLSGCSMYVTLEPCPMCAGAILQSRISKVYIGTFEPNTGACGSVINILQNDNLNRWTNVYWNYDEKCSSILEEFFSKKR